MNRILFQLKTNKTTIIFAPIDLNYMTKYTITIQTLFGLKAFLMLFVIAAHNGVTATLTKLQLLMNFKENVLNVYNC